jgi:hypothetical protein
LCVADRLLGGFSVDDTDVGAVNDAVTLLQMTFAELESDAAKLSNEALR